MKRSKLSMVVVAGSFILLATGCAGKNTKLVCTQSQSGVDMTFDVNFKGNVVDTMDIKYEMDLSKYTDKQVEAVGKQDFCTKVKSVMGQYKDGFEDCKQSIENKKLTVSSNINVDKIASSTRDKIGSPDATKKEIEQSGFKCTKE